MKGGSNLSFPFNCVKYFETLLPRGKMEDERFFFEAGGERQRQRRKKTMKILAENIWHREISNI